MPRVAPTVRCSSGWCGGIFGSADRSGGEAKSQQAQRRCLAAARAAGAVRPCGGIGLCLVSGPGVVTGAGSARDAEASRPQSRAAAGICGLGIESHPRPRRASPRHRAPGRRGLYGAERARAVMRLGGGAALPRVWARTLYALPPGVEIPRPPSRAQRECLTSFEKLRCSACGQIFTTPDA